MSLSPRKLSPSCASTFLYLEAKLNHYHSIADSDGEYSATFKEHIINYYYSYYVRSKKNIIPPSYTFHNGMNYIKTNKKYIKKRNEIITEIHAAYDELTNDMGITC